LRSLVLVLGAFAALTFAACGGESDGTFDHDGFPFTFSYPEDFEETEDVEISQQLGAESEDTVAIGLEEHDLITVERFVLRVEISERNLDLAKREIDGLFEQLGPDAPSTTKTEIAGFPALTASGVPVSSVEGASSDVSILFDGDQEYVINCQSTPDHRDEVTEACEMALETLSFE
jgi:hypothetical protein